MADSSPLVNLLEQASKVASWSGELGRAFYEEKLQQGRRSQIDPGCWERHALGFNGFCQALQGVQDAMLNPPEGFAPVAELLREAARIAVQIRDSVKTPDGRTIAGYLNLFPDLNSVHESLYHAVKQVTIEQGIDSPLGLLDDAGEAFLEEAGAPLDIESETMGICPTCGTEVPIVFAAFDCPDCKARNGLYRHIEQFLHSVKLDPQTSLVGEGSDTFRTLRHLIRERFGSFDLETLGQLRDWLIAKHEMTGEQVQIAQWPRLVDLLQGTEAGLAIEKGGDEHNSILYEGMKNLKHQAIWAAKYIDVVASEFKAAKSLHRAQTIETNVSTLAAFIPSGDSTRLPYAAFVAYSALSITLGEAIELYKRTTSFPNSSTVIAAIERFVHEIHLVPIWFSELERRVLVVESACATSSRYSAARTSALGNCKSIPAHLCRGKLALDLLHGNSTECPHFLSEVIEVRKSVEAVLEETSLGLSLSAYEAFATWRNACRKIHQEAERLEVDGCWYLYHVYRAAAQDPSERSRAAKATLQTKIGEANLDMIRAAAESLVAWVCEQPNSGDSLPDRNGGQADQVFEQVQIAKSECQQFSNGEIVFYKDKVEICGVDICSGPRTKSQRIVLELLSRQKKGKEFVAYSGEALESEAKQHGAKGTPGGWIRDLRDGIQEALRTRAKFISGREGLILSGDNGYRFAECLTVRYADPPTITDIKDTPESPVVPNDDFSSVPNDAAALRRAWILQRLAAGDQLQAPAVVKEFQCSLKTAQRDLQALKDEGRVEFVGAPRTGYYRVVPATEPNH